MENSIATVDATRGALPLATMALLTRGPAHGYALLEGLAGLGLHGVRSGTLYPLLRRLHEAGLVTPAWEVLDSGAPRKTYAVTREGRAACNAASEQLLATATAIAETTIGEN